MNEINPLVVELQARMFAGGLRIGEVLRKAGLERTTWWRWTQGAEPKFSSVEKMKTAIEEIQRERAA